ncbi:MAG: UDP-N-acetylglucosamine 1-carboxyvinyltransferase [Planctomycetota bacterium]
MDAFVIHGGRPLRGTVRLHGSKNAALPLMAAALLTDHPVTLHEVPDLADIRNLVRLLEALGCSANRAKPNNPRDPDQPDDPGPLTLHAADASNSVAPYEIVRTMRAGICVLGPMLAKRGAATVSMPGGCAIGDRPVDLHLRGLAQLGADITLTAGDITARAPRNGPRDTGRLRGAHVFLGGPNGSTVLGTANVMSAATLATGTTIIEAAACEPEVVDLARLLNAMGAKITGAGSPRITIEGVDALGPADHTVIPDRIEAGTYVMAAAITNGDVTLERFPHGMLTAALDRLREVGVAVEPVNDQPLPIDDTPATVRVVAERRLRPTHVVTQPHPGFPTDLQAQLMALLTLADGNSIVTEKIFPERFLHVAELARMGATLIRSGPTVMVSGVPQLRGAPVMASDLRASAGLVLAGLAASGKTIVNRVYHLDRGYQRMETTLQALGAEISRINDRDL